MERKVKFLMEYFNLLVAERTLEVGTILPSDCEYLVKELEKIEQDERTKEFAV